MNNIMAQISKPEQEHYLHVTLFIPNTTSIIKATKKGFLKTWPGLTKKLTNRNLEKSRNTTIGHLYMRIQGLKYTKEKPHNTDLEDNNKTNVVFCTTLDPSTAK